MSHLYSQSKLLWNSPRKSFFLFTIGLSVAFISSCQRNKHTEITIDSSRELTSEEILQNTQPNKEEKETPTSNNTSSSYTYTQPESWLQKAATPFRILNFTFGEKGETYLSESRGGILPNANRWLKQFAQPPLADTSTLETVSLLGKKAYLIETKGTFKGMRMPEPIENFALLGALTEIDGALITIKMTGTSEEVALQKSNFISFCNSLEKK